jgi:hypothetical protein
MMTTHQSKLPSIKKGSIVYKDNPTMHDSLSEYNFQVQISAVKTIGDLIDTSEYL